MSGLTAAEIDGSLIAMALVEAALKGQQAELCVLFRAASETPDGVAPSLVSALTALLREVMGEDAALLQVAHWRERIMQEVASDVGPQ